jgi:O-antigen/teichoic acid export membrane protein
MLLNILRSLLVRFVGASLSLAFVYLVATSYEISYSAPLLAILNLLFFTSVVSCFGSPNIILKSNNNEITKTGFILSLASALFVTMAFLSYLIFSNKQYYLTLVLAVPLYIIIRLTGYAYQALGKKLLPMFYISIVTPLVGLLTLAIGGSDYLNQIIYICLLAIPAGFGLYSIFWGATFNTISNEKIDLLTISKSSIWTEWLKQGQGVTMSQVFIWLGQIIAIYKLNAPDLLLIVIAQRVANSIGLVISVSNITISNKISVAFKENNIREFRSLMSLSSTFCTLISILVLTTFFIGGEKIVYLLDDSIDFDAVFLVLLAFLLMQTFSSIGASYFTALSMMGFPNLVLRSFLAATLLTLSSFFILIYFKLSDLHALCIAMLLGYAASNLIAFVQVRKKINIKDKKGVDDS